MRSDFARGNMAEDAKFPVSRATSSDEGLGAASPHGAPGGSLFIVTLGPEHAELPASCACCAAPPTTSRVLRRPAAAPLVVPYCARCHARLGRLRTRTLSFAVAAGLLAVTFAGALPVLFNRLSFLGYAAAVSFASLIPAAIALALAQRRHAVHPTRQTCRSESPAVFWWARHELACQSEAFASAVAAHHDVPIRARRPPFNPASPWLALGPALALASAWLLYPLHYPELRVVNLSGAELSIYVDGEPFGVVQPTSAESSRAGLQTRVAAGLRTLEARTAEGEPREHLQVRFEGGQNHLFAPASPGFCFWLESTSYGRARAPDRPLSALDPEQRFWVLRGPVDSWFAPNPMPGSDDERSTGGVLTALRQGRCGELPPALAPGDPGSEAASE